MLKDVDIQYDKKTIRFVLNNWNLIKVAAQKHPNDYIHAIYMDFDKAMNDVELTVRQNQILYSLINGENITSYNRDIDFICEKFRKILK